MINVLPTQDYDWERPHLTRRKLITCATALLATNLLQWCKSEEEKEAERIAEMNKRNAKNQELLEHFQSWSWIMLIWKWWELSCYHGKADRNTITPRNAKIYKLEQKWTYWEDIYQVELNKNQFTPDLLKWSFTWIYILGEHCRKLEEVE